MGNVPHIDPDEMTQQVSKTLLPNSTPMQLIASDDFSTFLHCDFSHLIKFLNVTLQPSLVNSYQI
jgi:hypothetical protein